MLSTCYGQYLHIFVIICAEWTQKIRYCGVLHLHLFSNRYWNLLLFIKNCRKLKQKSEILRTMCDGILYISEEKVKELLTWELVFSATEAALKCVTENRVVQNPRTFTVLRESRNCLLCMPGYLQHDNYGALACKLVTSFPNNSKLNPPLPTIIGNIFLFDEATGVLNAVSSFYLLESTGFVYHRSVLLKNGSKKINSVKNIQFLVVADRCCENKTRHQVSKCRKIFFYQEYTSFILFLENA